MPLILDNISYYHGPGNPGLEGISLTAGDGEAIGIAGPMGAGKTTLLQVIRGLLRPTTGTVLLDGQPLQQGDQRQPAIAMVFQYPEDQLFGETVFEDVAMGLAFRSLTRAEVRERVREALQAVGLDPDQIGPRPPWQLSGGEQRRVALAGALVTEPRFLLLDEPTAGLDPRSREELLGYLGKLHREKGVGILVVSHWLEDLARLADRLLILNGGRVVMDGSTRDLLGARSGELEALGLEPPAAPRLAAALRQAGWPLAPGLVTIEELYREMTVILKHGRTGHEG